MGALSPLHGPLPLLGWQRVRPISRELASTLTRGDLDKFSNKDYYVLGSLRFASANEIPADAMAVYLHDGQWWLVRKA